MNGYRSDKDIIQNLRDAGCDDATIQCFMEKIQSDKQAQGVQLLQKHRCSLLDKLHKDQKQIDCLDYLLFMVKKQSHTKG